MPATQKRAKRADDDAPATLQWAPIAISQLRRVRAGGGSVGDACLYSVAAETDEELLDELSAGADTYVE